MKSKRTCSSHSHALGLTNSIDKNKTTIDLRLKPNPITVNFLKKSTSLIKNTALVGGSIDSCGHPDVYFKRTLRNYDYFGIGEYRSSTSTRVPTSQTSLSDSIRGASSNLRNSKSRSNQKPKRKVKKYKAKQKDSETKISIADKGSLKNVDDKDIVINRIRSEGYLRTNKKRALRQEEDDEEVFYSPQRFEGYPLNGGDSTLIDRNLQEDNSYYYYDAVSPHNQDKMEEEEEIEDVFEGTENLIEQVEEEIQEVIDDNPEVNLDGTETDDEAAAPTADQTAEGKPAEEDAEPTGDGLPIGEIPSVIPDSDVMREVEECEKQCMEIYGILNELKKRVGELMSKPKRTDQEDKELDEKQRQLNEKMLLLEHKTRRIEILVGRTKTRPSSASRPRRYDEDILPKVLICGVADNNMPKIIVCDDKKQQIASSRRRSTTARGDRLPPCSNVLPPTDISVMPQFAKRLSESYCMQEKLAAENADLEGMRYRLQEDLLNKDETVESLQKKLTSLTAEMRMVVKENGLLNERLCQLQNCGAPCNKARGDDQAQESKTVEPSKMAACGKGKGTCPADVETRLQEYSETTHALEKQLNDMESEVRNMQNELLSVQKERMHLEQHRKMLAQCPGMICPPSPCVPVPICVPPPPVCPPASCPAPCNSSRGAAVEMQLRELREQYNRLQDDYKGKMTEVSGLRADSEKLKVIGKDFDEYKKNADEKIKALEKELKELKLSTKKNLGSKEQLFEQEQQLAVAKQRYREAKDELEEVRALVEDQQNQLDDYRNKYMQAQQQVEEQRRQIDLMEMENARVNEQVNLEIQRVKNQFQEKLQELTPLPDILKATQLKLQEAQQMHLLAERNNEAMVRELQAYRDKAAAMANQMEKVRSDQQLGADEVQTLQSRLEESENRVNELMAENDELRMETSRLEDATDEAEKRAQEKLHQIAQLEAEIENVREESARQVARTKDRCETVRRSMQHQIAELERQLAQSRAQARQAQKDRDEIRQKMQAQINNLNENFEDAQMRIRNLQGHVNFLKNSYSNVFPSQPNGDELLDNMDPCNCGNF